MRVFLIKLCVFLLACTVIVGGIYVGATALLNPSEDGGDECLHRRYSLILVENPTCSRTGYTGDKQCNLCGEVFEYGHTIPKADHTPRSIPAAAPTCLKAGNTAGSICAVCSTYIQTPTTIAKLEHNIINTPELEPTCSEFGSRGGKHCTLCSTVFEESEIIPMLDHVWVTEEGYSSTCMSEGLSDATVCERCGEYAIDHAPLPINPDAHCFVPVEGDEYTASTCTANGRVPERECSNVDAEGNKCSTPHLPAQTIPAGHSVESWVTTIEPGENSAGEAEGTCTECGSTVTKDIPAIGDDDGDLDNIVGGDEGLVE